MGIRTIIVDMRTEIKGMLTGAGRVLAAVVSMVLVLAAGCVSRSFDLSCTSPYQEQMGVQYELAVDSYVVTLKDMDEIFLVNRFSTFRLPYPVESRYIGKATTDLNIKGVIRQGAVLKVAFIRGRQSFDAGGYVDYFLEAGDEVQGPRIKVNARFLQTNRDALFQLNNKSFKRLGSPSPPRGEGRSEGGQVNGGKL
jgi:hypothetical protein